MKIFIHIPKCGGTSIKDCFNIETVRDSRKANNLINNPSNRIVSFGHLDLKKYFIKKFFTFTFMRNPYERVISLYNYWFDKHDFIKKESFTEFCRRLYERYKMYKGYYPGWINHFAPQTYSIQDKRLDFIGSMTNFNDDIKKLSKILNIEIKEIPKLNSSIKRSIFMTDECKKLIETVYVNDFKYMKELNIV